MKTTISILTISTLASATINFTHWHPPVPGDLRSPCPALNALANHCIIPHDGRNLTVPMLVKAFKDSMNVSEDFTTFVGTAALPLAPDKGASGQFSLEDIRIHGGMEHDASLSRKDFAVDSDANSFSPEIFNEFLSYFNGSNDATIPLAAAARWGRVETERARNPNFTYAAGDRLNSYIQSAIYRQSLKAPDGSVPMDWVKVWYQEERLPYEEGWRPTQDPISGLSLAGDILLLVLATPEEKLGFNSARSLHGRMFY